MEKKTMDGPTATLERKRIVQLCAANWCQRADRETLLIFADLEGSGNLSPAEATKLHIEWQKLIKGFLKEAEKFAKQKRRREAARR